MSHNNKPYDGFSPSGIVTLLTDFGTSDGYVGTMKGVMLSINPGLKIVDITHDILHGSLIHGAIILRDTFSYFPEGTVHTVVVDPGVGTERRPILVKRQGHFFVGPDNGILGEIIPGASDIIHLTNEKFFLPNLSATFHGRDIFAPVSAHLTNGVPPESMGVRIFDPVSISIPRPVRKGGRIEGEVIYIDHFGNMITNIRNEDIILKSLSEPVVKVTCRSRHDQESRFSPGTCLPSGDEEKTLCIKGINRTYGEVERGRPLALFGSSGYMEIALNMGKASEFFGIEKGKEMDVKVVVENVQGPQRI